MQLDNEAATEKLGAQFANACSPPAILYLVGDLGTGKTTFARGFLHALGHSGSVKSPTFSLLETYNFEKMTVYHLDLYRLKDPQELEFIGIRELSAENDAICLFEWPEKGEGALPSADIQIHLQHQDECRLVDYRADTEVGQAIIAKL